MRACEAPSSVASQSPDSRDKDVKNSGAVLIKAGEERKKQHPEKIEVAQGNDKERNFVRGFAVKPGDHVVKKLLQAGFLLFENFRKKLSCEISYYTLLKMVFYYINGRIGKYEWKERIVAMIRKHPGLMDEFQRYVIDISQQTIVFLLNTMQCNPN
jgi:paired amphipathic helix protein Sin3a